MLTPLALARGLEIVDIESLGSGSILRIYIDNEKGVTVDDCASFSRVVSDVLDVEFSGFSNFNLEVSSPGIERVIKKERDFLKYIGRKIKLKTFAPVQGQRKFLGIIKGLENDILFLDSSGCVFEIDKVNIAKANLVFEGDV